MELIQYLLKYTRGYLKMNVLNSNLFILIQQNRIYWRIVHTFFALNI